MSDRLVIAAVWLSWFALVGGLVVAGRWTANHPAPIRSLPIRQGSDAAQPVEPLTGLPAEPPIPPSALIPLSSGGDARPAASPPGASELEQT